MKSIKKTTQPDFKFISYTAWCKYIYHQSQKFKRLNQVPLVSMGQNK